MLSEQARVVGWTCDSSPLLVPRNFATIEDAYTRVLANGAELENILPFPKALSLFECTLARIERLHNAVTLVVDEGGICRDADVQVLSEDGLLTSGDVDSLRTETLWGMRIADREDLDVVVREEITAQFSLFTHLYFEVAERYSVSS